MTQVETREKEGPILNISKLSDFSALVVDAAELKDTFMRSQTVTQMKYGEKMRYQTEILNKLNMLISTV